MVLGMACFAQFERLRRVHYTEREALGDMLLAASKRNEALERQTKRRRAS